MEIYKDCKERAFYLYIRKHWNINAAAKAIYDNRKELKIRKRRAVVATIEFLVQHACTEKEIFDFLGKYAQLYRVTLSNSMINHFINLTNSNYERLYEKEVKINPNFDDDKKFLFDDIQTLKELGFCTEEIIKLFDKLLLHEYFSPFERKIIISEVIIKKI